MKYELRNAAPWIVAFLCFAQEPSIVLAEGRSCYKLIHGTRNPVCRKLEQNLNRFCHEPPMRCELKIHPDFTKDFSIPKWEDLDPLANIELVAELVRANALVAHDCTGDCDTNWRERKWQEYRPKLLEGIGLGRIRFSRAHFDINHDGVKELVFRLMDTGCPKKGDEPNYSYGNPSLLVMDEATGKFDRDFIRQLRINTYDVILHQGRASFIVYDSFKDTWRLQESASSPGAGRFVIFGYPVCEYKILDQGRNK